MKHVKPFVFQTLLRHTSFCVAAPSVDAVGRGWGCCGLPSAAETSGRDAGSGIISLEEFILTTHA